MRLIGTISNKVHAESFCDYLYTQGIQNQINTEDNQSWEIWVESDDDLDRAKEFLTEFLTDPENKKYYRAKTTASEMRAEIKKDEELFQKRFFGKEKLFVNKKSVFTLSLIGLSLVITLLAGFGKNPSLLKYFLITNAEIYGGYIRWIRGLPDIFQQGQVWRLITPIFIHFGLIHLLFNMLWLNDLGGMIEQRQKPWFLGLMVLVIGVCSNLGQYFVSGPMFGGMSGVVYGLLGYVWLRGKFDPSSGYFMHQHIVIMMIIWFFLCLFRIIPNVANMAHAIGLGMGCAWGYLSAVIRRK